MFCRNSHFTYSLMRKLKLRKEAKTMRSFVKKQICDKFLLFLRNFDQSYLRNNAKFSQIEFFILLDTLLSLTRYVGNPVAFKVYCVVNISSFKVKLISPFILYLVGYFSNQIVLCLMFKYGHQYHHRERKRRGKAYLRCTLYITDHPII